MDQGVTPPLAAAEGATQTIGPHAGLNAGCGSNDEQKSLVARGSESRLRRVDHHRVAERRDPVVAAAAGIAADHVVGFAR